MRFLKQSTSVVVQFGPFVDKTDGVALEVGLATSMDNATTGIRLSKNGAAFADRGDATAPAYDAMGCYRITLSTTDTNTLGVLRMIFEEAATCAPHWDDFMVMPANVWDSLFGSDALDVSVVQWLGTAAATPTTAGVPEVDVTHVSGTAQTAGDLQALITTVDTVVDGIQADLDNGTDGLGALKSILDTSGVVTTATGLDAVLKSSTFALAMADAIWDEVLTGVTHNVANSAGKRLRAIDAGFEVLSGTATAGSSTTITFESGASTTNDIYNGDRIVITAGTGAGEHGLILDYDGGTLVATMSKAWVVTPDATSEYTVIPADSDVELWNGAAVTGDGDWAALKAETALIVADTNELQTDWTNAGRLDAILDKIPLSDGTVSWNATALAAINAEVDTALNTAIPAAAAGSINDVLKDLDALLPPSGTLSVYDATAAVTQPGQEAPTVNQTTEQAIAYLYKAWRNRVTQTATEYSLYNDDASTVDQKSTVSDNGTTFDKGEIGSGV